MADGVRVEVTGARELRRKLRRLGDDLEDMKDIHRTAGNIVAAQARVDAPYRSGATVDSVRVQVTKSRAKIVAGTVGASKRYAAAVHWGWPSKARKTWGGPIPANPWLYNAMGKTGWQVASFYYRARDALVTRINASGTRGFY